MEAGEEALKNSQSAVHPNSLESKLAVGNAFEWEVVQSAEWLQIYFGSIYRVRIVIVIFFFHYVLKTKFNNDYDELDGSLLANKDCSARFSKQNQFFALSIECEIQQQFN